MQDHVQRSGPTSYFKLKKMVPNYLNPKTREQHIARERYRTKEQGWTGGETSRFQHDDATKRLRKKVLETEAAKANVIEAASASAVQDLVVGSTDGNKTSWKRVNSPSGKLDRPARFNLQNKQCDRGTRCDYWHCDKANPAKEQFQLQKDTP